MMPGSDRAEAGRGRSCALQAGGRAAAAGATCLPWRFPWSSPRRCWTVMNFIDRMFLLWHSTEEMAAAMPAGMVHFALVCLAAGRGLLREHVRGPISWGGPSPSDRAGRLAGSSAWDCCACPLYLTLIPLAPWLFRLVGHEAKMAHLEAIYFQTAALGAGAEVMAAALSAFFTGLGINRVVMIVDIVGRAAERRARLRLDFRPFRLARAGHRRGRLGHRDVALVSRGGLCRVDDAAALSAALSVMERAAFPRRVVPSAAALRRSQRAANAGGDQPVSPCFSCWSARLVPRRHGGHHPGLQREHFGLCAHARAWESP